MINIGYINYDGKKYPIRVRYYALEKFQEETGIKFSEMGNTEEGQRLKHYEPLLFYALESGAMALKEKMAFDRKQIPAVLDECLWEFVQLVPEFMPEVEEGKELPQKSRGQKRQSIRTKKSKNKKLT